MSNKGSKIYFLGTSFLKKLPEDVLDRKWRLKKGRRGSGGEMIQHLKQTPGPGIRETCGAAAVQPTQHGRRGLGLWGNHPGSSRARQWRQKTTQIKT